MLQVYTIYSILSLVFIILIIVTGALRLPRPAPLCTLPVSDRSWQAPCSACRHGSRLSAAAISVATCLLCDAAVSLVDACCRSMSPVLQSTYCNARRSRPYFVTSFAPASGPTLPKTVHPRDFQARLPQDAAAGVAGFICIALTYFQLAVEDHRWWWRSFLCGGSTGVPLGPPQEHPPDSNPDRFVDQACCVMLVDLMQKQHQAPLW